MSHGEELTTAHPALAPESRPALSAGARFGAYEILARAGAGGMGEVYRARDTRLGREVAIKILSPKLSLNRERLSRFQQEARSASALNHPNIVTIYELGQADATHYIAMELVRGTTLRQRLGSGPLPMRKAIEFAAQAADGLAKAHDAGIVHRDLKPENLMVSEDGLVKILDFGLAKLVLTGNSVSDMRTDDGSYTQPGMILGTVAYMSPEQASGQPLDFRSDQFSFGLVLYEMVTGKRALLRSSVAETLAAILRDSPEPVAALNPDAPAPLCWIIERCLAKEPARRYGSTRELAGDLVALRDGFLQALPRQAEARLSSLPTPRTAFVGRSREVATAKELLLRPEVPLITVTGPAGIGKTRLALQVAGEMMDQYPGGVYFVPLAAVSDPELLASVIAQTLGARETGAHPPLTTLKEYLRNAAATPMLLLLDNFEHLTAAAPRVAELLASGPGLKVLVTSRAPLRIYGEHEFPLPPLTVPESPTLPSLEALSNYSAVALFTQRAAAVKPDFELTADNAPAVAEICTRLDGLPLAIELAAARIKLLSPSVILARLASRLQLLTGGARDLPARQQTLRGAIDWSYDLLDAAEQKLFQRLAVFVGGCTLEAAEAVCNTRNDLGLDLLEGMASIVDKSLLQQVDAAGHEPRFVMLETIREYAAEKLSASTEDDLISRAHAAYYLVLAEEGASEVGSKQQAAWLDRFELEHDNFRAALHWLVGSKEAEWGLRLGAALFQFWETREYLNEGRDWLGKLLRIPAAAAPGKARARALFAAAVLAGAQRDYASADTLLQQSLAIARDLGDQRGVAVSLNALAVYARDAGRLAASRSLFEESLQLWREVGDQEAVARALSNLASVAKLQREYARAHALYQECLTIFQQIGDRTSYAWSLNHQGDVARDQGDYLAARRFYQESLATFREVGDRWAIAGSLADQGNLAVDEGDYRAAHSLYGESLKIFRELGQKRGIARVLECFASSAAAQSQPERALRLAGAAAALRQALGAPLPPAEHARFQATIERARRALPNATGAAAWLQGWELPVEKAIDEVVASSAC